VGAQSEGGSGGAGDLQELEGSEGSLVLRTTQDPVLSVKDNLAGALRAFRTSVGPTLTELAANGVNLLSVGGKWSAKAIVLVGGALRDGWLTLSKSLKEPAVGLWVWAKVVVQRVVKPRTPL